MREAAIILAGLLIAGAMVLDSVKENHMQRCEAMWKSHDYNRGPLVFSSEQRNSDYQEAFGVTPSDCNSY